LFPGCQEAASAIDGKLHLQLTAQGLEFAFFDKETAAPCGAAVDLFRTARSA
jgi:hypothetical protein